MDKKLFSLYEKFRNKWVALSKNYSVIVSGNSVADVEEQLHKKRVKAEEIRFILPTDGSYSPLCM